MKVAKLSTVVLSIPMRPFGGVTAPPTTETNLVIVNLTTDEGLAAFSLAHTFQKNQLRSLKASIDDLGEIIIGQDVFRGAEAWKKMWDFTKMGRAGFGIYGLSTIDNALWCLRAKALGMPLARLLGGYREEVLACGAHKLWRLWSLDELQKDAASLVEQGFRLVKMKLGGRSDKEELERVKVVREAVGEDVSIIADVNWAWTVPQTIRMGHELERYNIYSIKVPIPNDDLDGSARIASAINIPLCLGERVSTKYGFRSLLEKKILGILMIDIQTVGGITEWMKVAAMAEAWNIPVAGHLFFDFHMHLIAAIPNGLYANYNPFWKVIYQEPPQVKNGYLKIPDKPGLGLELDPKAIKKYEMK